MPKSSDGRLHVRRQCRPSAGTTSASPGDRRPSSSFRSVTSLLGLRLFPRFLQLFDSSSCSLPFLTKSFFHQALYVFSFFSLSMRVTTILFFVLASSVLLFSVVLMIFTYIFRLSSFVSISISFNYEDFSLSLFFPTSALVIIILFLSILLSHFCFV